MLKNCFCLFVRWQYDPLARRPVRLRNHLSACAGCRDFFETAATLGEELRQPTVPADPALCERIMRDLRGLESRPAVETPSRFSWQPSFALAALVVTGFLSLWFFWPEGQTGQAEPESLAKQPPLPTASPPESTPMMGKIDEIPGAESVRSMASLIEQQEMIRRDAKKLGSHLRERVILFQSTD